MTKKARSQLLIFFQYYLIQVPLIKL